MKNIFELGNEYAKKSSWKDFALLRHLRVLMMYLPC